MANEIYDSTWWGNTIQTASSIGTSTEMIQGQFNMLTSNQPNLVVNGDFATDSDWTLGTGWSIEDNKAVCDGSDGVNMFQNGVIENLKKYKISFSILNYVSGFLNGRIGSANSNDFTVSSDGNYSFNIISDGTNLIFRSSSFNGSIDNVSVKEVRAEEVEAVKCLADAIHRIGIQDIQN